MAYNINQDGASGNVVIGSDNGSGSTFWVEEIQFLANTQWHSANYTPPSAPFGAA
jgi:hypothetical protein